MIKNKVVLGIVGPTASGKTALSLPLAEKLHAEIVCMDSMQIYQEMNIGTAKPTATEQQLIPHHLVDFVSPFDSFSVTQYAEAAKPLLDSLMCPMLVGGTGLYLQSVSLPMDYGSVPGNEEIRQKYHQMVEEKGVEYVHGILEKYDPVSSKKLHPNDIRRVIRALEVYEQTGIPLSQQQQPSMDDSPYEFLLYALDWPRDVLYAHVNDRVDQMMRDGLADEVRHLLNMGVPVNAQSMQGLGYKEIASALNGETALDDAVDLIKLRTRHFAKRQLTWFRHDPRVIWLPAAKESERYVELIIQQYQETSERIERSHEN